MPTFAYLKAYGLTTIDDVNYDLAFSIPENCNYSSNGSNGVFCVTIALNPGQTQPSPRFVSQVLTYVAVKGGLTVEFQQPDQDGKKRPVITVQG